jgi:integrase
VWEELLKLPASTSPSAAKVAWAEWCAEIDTRIATLRAAAKGEGRPLTQVNALALAGKWYSWFLAQHENDSRLASHWAELRDYLVWDVIGREAPDKHKADTDADPHWEWAKAPEVRDAVRPVIAELARVASFLSGAGMALDDSAYTVANVWLAVSKSVFSWGVEQGLIPANPFAGIRVTKEKKIRERPGKTFTTEESAIILQACQKMTVLKTSLDRAKRWVPLLCAYTGARPGEMTQLRSEDIYKDDKNYFARLAPSAGTIKGGKGRIVPLHEHLIELGFAAFVSARGPGPMFYKPSTNSKAIDPLNPKRGPAVKARENLGEWVRSLGVTDPELSPSHAWRHTFLSKARQAGIEPALRFGITGHATKSEGEAYGQPEPEELAEALKKFPRYEFVTRTPRRAGIAVESR